MCHICIKVFTLLFQVLWLSFPCVNFPSKRRQWSVSKLKGKEWGSSSAGADAVDGDDGRVHQTQFLMLVNTQLITTAPPALQRSHLGVGLGARRQEEAHAPRDQHVPNAVDVEVVLLCLHKGVEGHSRCGNHGARKEEEHPALPGRRVATPPTNGTHRLAGQEIHKTMFSTSLLYFNIWSIKKWEPLGSVKWILWHIKPQ